MKRSLLVLCSMFLLAGIGFSVLSAQPAGAHQHPASALQQGCSPVRACTPTPAPPRDLDRDGVPDTSDRCPTVPGTAANQGCPEDPAPSDRDGDGVPDVNDRCPDAGGPSSNSGCPEGAGVPDTGDSDTGGTTPNLILLPALPTDGDCVLATQGATRVNLRALPSTTAEIVGLLDPQIVYPVLAALENAEGAWARLADGWVARWVVRLGGACLSLPAVQLGGSDSIWMDMGAPLSVEDFRFETVDAAPDTGEEVAGCSNNLMPIRRGTWILDASRDSTPGGHGVQTVEWIFGTELPTAPADQFCVQIEPDATGFTIYGLQDPPDPVDITSGESDQASERPRLRNAFPVKWGIVEQTDEQGNLTTVITARILLPASEGDPPDPVIPAVIISWLLPYKPADTGAHALYYDVVIPPSDDGDLMITWWLNPDQQPGPPTDPDVSVNPGPPTDPDTSVNPGPPNDPDASINPSPPEIAQSLVIRLGDPPDPIMPSIIVSWLPGGADAAPFAGRGLDIARIDGVPVNGAGALLEFVIQ